MAATSNSSAATATTIIPTPILTATDIDIQQHPSMTEPLHSQSHSSIPTFSKKRLRYNNKLSITLVTLFLCILTLSSPVQAKFRLVPKTKNARKNHQKSRQNQKSNQSQSQSQSQHLIILKPKPKKEAVPVKLKLEATISTNEHGEKVMQLSPESTEAVNSAMQSTAKEVGEATMKLEATKPAKQMATTVDVPQKTESESSKVLFYHPEELMTSPGEPPLPRRVFDEDGNEVDMAGKEALLVKPPPPDSDGGDDAIDANNEKTNSNNNSSGSTKSNNSNNSSKTSTILQTTQTQDQMIIISTVATMALLVGALSARRLRSRQFLSFCIENESLEDEMAYDAAYTTQSTVGASSMYAGGGYDTFASGKYGGDLRWRGDLEKFDV